MLIDNSAAPRSIFPVIRDERVTFGAAMVVKASITSARPVRSRQPVEAEELPERFLAQVPSVELTAMRYNQVKNDASPANG